MKNKVGRLFIPGSPLFRVVTPPLIFVANPILITALAIYADGADAPYYRRLKFNRAKYELVDKSLDLYWYLIALLYAIHYLPHLYVLVSLFAFRLVGQLIFFISRNDAVFLFFPSFFEGFFVLFLLTENFPKVDSFLEGKNMLIAVLLVISLKIFQELFTHGFDERIQPLLPEWLKAPA